VSWWRYPQQSGGTRFPSQRGLDGLGARPALEALAEFDDDDTYGKRLELTARRLLQWTTNSGTRVASASQGRSRRCLVAYNAAWRARGRRERPSPHVHEWGTTATVNP
jgi:hypothetical protein